MISVRYDTKADGFEGEEVLQFTGGELTEVL